MHENKFFKANSQKQIQKNKFYVSKNQIRKTNSVKQIPMFKTQIHGNKFIKQMHKTNSFKQICFHGFVFMDLFSTDLFF